MTPSTLDTLNAHPTRLRERAVSQEVATQRGESMSPNLKGGRLKELPVNLCIDSIHLRDYLALFGLRERNLGLI